jgi:hypothetical protein
MNKKTSATSEQVEASVDQSSPADMTLEDMKAEIERLNKQMVIKDQQIDDMKRKEEGWLVWTKNPMFNGMTMSVLFTDGMAFIPVEREYPEGNAKKVVGLLQSDFGYEVQYFTKEQTEELNKSINRRALERKEVQDRLGTREDMLSKLLQAHHL